MDCKNHKGVPAAFVCTVCGEALCSDCAIELNNTVYCRECLEGIISGKTGGRPYKRYWWMAVILSIVPGTGHMYLGMIKKGLSLMSLFFTLVLASVLLAESSGIYWLAAFLIPTFSFLFLSYSVFDCMSLADRVNSGEDLSNEGIYELSLLRDLIVRRKGLFSLLLIFAGGIGIVNIFARFIGDFIKQITGVGFSLSGLLLALLLVLLGLYLLREGRR